MIYECAICTVGRSDRMACLRRVEDDGIEANVHRIRDLWPNLKPLATRRPTEVLRHQLDGPLVFWLCHTLQGTNIPTLEKGKTSTQKCLV